MVIGPLKSPLRLESVIVQGFEDRSWDGRLTIQICV